MNLETERFTIRDPIEEDWQGAHSFLSDAEVMRWIHLGPKPFAEAQSKQWIADLIYHNRQQPRDAHNSLIVERATGQVIGWIGLGKPSPHRAASGDLDFGYALARPYWSKGYMTEALRALLRFAFTELGAQRVFAICEVQNVGSARVMEKAGMQREHRFLEPEENGMPAKEMFLYALSKDAWQAWSQH